MLKINKILSIKIKSPLSLRGLFPFCHSRESGNPSPHVIARERSNRSNLNLNGFSLIELMVAAAILSLAIFGIFQAFGTGFLGMFDARDRTVATNYVQEKMEELKNADFDTVVDEASSQIVGDIKFSRNINVEYINGSTNLIVAGPTNLKRVTTTVNWTDRNGVTKKVESSVLLQNTQFTADPYNVVLPVTSSTTIIAVIKDKSGNTIFDWDGSDVTFTIISEVSVEGESLEGLLGTLSAYAVTPVKGKASVVFTSSVAELQGTVTVEASVTTSDGLNTFTDTIDIDITWGAVKIELIPNPSSILADGTSQSTIIAIIENAAGERVDEALNDITFTVAGEGTLIGPTTKPANETYDSITGGVATILLQSTTTPGIATVTASSPELLSDSCDVQTSGEPAGITLSASPNPMYSDDTSEVTVTVVDENGVPVIPTAGSITITLSTSEGSLAGDTPLTFVGVSSQSMVFTPSITEGLATIYATDTYEGSIDISVELLLEAEHIALNANPSTILADGISTSIITATIENVDDITVHNYIGNVNFSILSGPGEILSATSVLCDNGVATIILESGGPGICEIQAVSGILPIANIDVGFYTEATKILLTAIPVHIPVGGGNEGTSILTASIKDAGGTTVYDYDGDVLFSFSGGYNSTAKFKFVNNPSYSVPVFHGSASVYLLSLNDSGDASLEATSDSLTPDELTLYIQKTLKESVPFNVVYDSNDKGVSFNIEVLGGDMQIGDIEVVWSPVGGEHLISIKFANDEVFSGSILSGEDIVITPTVLPEGTSTIYLGFGEGIADKDITVIFYSPIPVSNYQLDSYTISF
jgi:prepilin-type N-terminal cleavage/methylation domain-containing protein